MIGSCHSLSDLWTRGEIRYMVIAGLNAAIYLAIFGALLGLHMHYGAAILASQALAVSLAFPLNRWVVFRSTGPVVGELMRFLGVWTTGAVAGAVGTPVLVHFGGLHPWWAQATAIAVVGASSFLGHSFFSFSEMQSTRSNLQAREVRP